MSTTGSGTATVTLPTDEQIRIARHFQAPPARVFRVWSTPELVQQWWSGHHGTTTSVEMDFRVGGRGGSFRGSVRCSSFRSLPRRSGMK